MQPPSFRSYSPIRSTHYTGSSAFSPRDTSTYTSRYSGVREKPSYETSDMGIKPRTITATTRTVAENERRPMAPVENKEPAEKKSNPRSSRERSNINHSQKTIPINFIAARRNSRQRSQSKSLSRVSSSSDEEAAPTSRDPPKKRRLRNKRTSSLSRENGGGRFFACS